MFYALLFRFFLSVLVASFFCGDCIAKKKKKQHRKIQKKVESDRPKRVQEAVDKAFEKNKKGKRWTGKNGSSRYKLFGLNDDSVLKKLAFPKKDEIYIIDVGCATGKWGRHAMDVLSKSKQYQKTKKIHIFSVTGGQECKEVITCQGNVMHYQLNQFKIENIDEEFLKRGFDLKNKVDLIVSRWTLRHLVDPVGTLKRMYRLLTSQQGIIMSNGFWFALDSSKKIQCFPKDNKGLLGVDSNSLFFRFYDDGQDLDDFLLMRNNNQELIIPEYTGDIHQVAKSYQCSSGFVTVFKKRKIVRPK